MRSIGLRLDGIDVEHRLLGRHEVTLAIEGGEIIALVADVTSGMIAPRCRRRRVLVWRVGILVNNAGAVRACRLEYVSESEIRANRNQPCGSDSFDEGLFTGRSARNNWNPRAHARSDRHHGGRSSWLISAVARSTWWSGRPSSSAIGC
jgi:hypothetical protein